MANSAQLTVTHGATPTQLAADGTDDSVSGNTLVLTNSGTVDLRLGGPDVSTANGWLLAVGGTLVVDVAEHLYAVVDAGNGATDGSCDLLRVR